MGTEKAMRVTFKEYLKHVRDKEKKKKGNQYPTKGVRDVVDFDKTKTHQAYRATNALSAPVSGVGGTGGGI